jgi:hypothetical protein
MIVGYMKSHGTSIVPAAAGSLLKISAEDLQKRVVEKFTGLQKNLREAGLLNSRNQRVVVTPIISEPVGDESEPLVEVKAESKPRGPTAAVLLSRAKGVCSCASWKYN